jgi:phospholipid/cholesterol/gamma-HCH transport system ATP-binding protein
MTKPKCIIEIKELYTSFGDHVIHEDVNLCVHRGEILTLIGSSGSGKTTLLRQMLGLEKPSGGNVKIFGGTPTDFNSQKKNIRSRSGVLFQQGALFSALTVFDNIALPLRELHILSERMIRDLVMFKLDMVAIEPEHASKMPAALSGGMIKRVALARALALDPKLLFLDEPTAGLDPLLSESFVELILTLRKEMDLTIVMVSHDLDTLIALSDRIAVLADRQIVITGTLEEVCHFQHPFITSFFKSLRQKLHQKNHSEQSWKTVLTPS